MHENDRSTHLHEVQGLPHIMLHPSALLPMHDDHGVVFLLSLSFNLLLHELRIRELKILSLKFQFVFSHVEL